MGEHHERDPRRIIGAARLDVAFTVERQLLPEKEISAASCDRDLTATDANLTTSTSSRTPVRHKIDRNTCFRMRKRATLGAPLLGDRHLDRPLDGDNRSEFQVRRNICGSQGALPAPHVCDARCRYCWTRRAPLEISRCPKHHPIQTFAPYGPNQSFDDRMGARHVRHRLISRMLRIRKFACH